MFRKKSIWKWLEPCVVERIYDNRKLLYFNTCNRLITTSIDMTKRYLNQISPEQSFPNTANRADDTQSGEVFKQAKATQNDLRKLSELPRLI